jgi:hypothetical protein
MQLYQSVEVYLRARGVTIVTAHASLAARTFFDRQGFTVGPEEHVACRGAALRRFAVWKALGAGVQDC